MQKRWRGHAGIFFLVCFRWFFEQNIPKNAFFSRSYTILSIYALVVGNTPYWKRYISRTEPVLLQAQHVRLKLTFTPIFFAQVPDQFDAFFNSKNASEKKAKISLCHLLVNLKNVRVLTPPMLFSIELWREWQPLIFPPIQASDGALRSVKHERRNVVIQVRGCRMTKIQE